MAGKPETEQTYTYEDMRKMYNDLAGEFNNLQEVHEFEEDVIQKLVTLLRKCLPILSSESRMQAHPEAKTMTETITEILKSHEVSTDSEQQQVAYDALFMAERQAIEKCRGELKASNKQVADLKTANAILVDKQTKTKRAYDEAKAEKKNMDRLLKAKIEDVKRVSEELDELGDAARDMRQSVAVLENESKSIQGIIHAKTAHLNEIKSSVQVELNKFLHYTNENKRHATKKRQEELIHSGAMGAQPKHADSEQDPQTFARDAIGRIIMCDGLSRMQPAPPADEWASQTPRLTACVEAPECTISSIGTKIAHVHELLTQTETAIQIMLSVSEVD